MDQQNTMQQTLPNATAVLVLGIISIIGSCCCYGIVGVILAIVALVMAKNAKELYQSNPDAYTASSFSNVKTGRIIAIIGLVLGVLALIFMSIYIIIFGFSALSDPEAFQEILEQLQNQ